MESAQAEDVEQSSCDEDEDQYDLEGTVFQLRNQLVKMRILRKGFTRMAKMFHAWSIVSFVVLIAAFAMSIAPRIGIVRGAPDSLDGITMTMATLAMVLFAFSFFKGIEFSGMDSRLEAEAATLENSIEHDESILSNNRAKEGGPA